MATATPARTTDISTMLSKLSKRDKKQALTILLRDAIGKKKSRPLTITDESDRELGLFFPTEYKVVDLNLDADTPRARELKRRANDRDSLITHEEMIARLHAIEDAEGRE